MRQKVQDTTPIPTRSQPSPADPDALEKELINLAMKAARQRLIDGTATSQEIVYFLKRGSSTTRTEDEILEKQKELITAKTEQIKSAERTEELFKEGIEAIMGYRGTKDNGEYNAEDIQLFMSPQ
jgi:hypothetical protein